LLSITSLEKKTGNSTISPYRDRVYIIKDIIVKLVDYGTLNQTSLISFCGLNLKKHRSILFELELNELISRSETTSGHRTITIYKPTQKGIEFCNKIIEPYEKMFPRQRQQPKSSDIEAKAVQSGQKSDAAVNCEYDNQYGVTETGQSSVITLKEKSFVR
jgi:predicted transcriptional regulator